MARAWLVRTNVTSNMFERCKNANIIAIGWGETGCLKGKTKEDIKKIVGKQYTGLVGTKLGNAYAVVNMFVNEMQAEDLVVVPNGNEIYLAQIKSDYFFDDSFENKEYPHIRQVEWKLVLSRDELPENVRRSLRVLRTAANLTKHYDELRALIFKEQRSAKENIIDLSYPLRANFIIKFAVPSNMTENEAQRFSKYISTLYFE